MTSNVEAVFIGSDLLCEQDHNYLKFKHIYDEQIDMLRDLAKQNGLDFLIRYADQDEEPAK